MTSNLIGVYGSNPISALRRQITPGDIFEENLDHRLVRFLLVLNAQRFKRIVEAVGNNRNTLYKDYIIKSTDVGFSYSRYENVNAAYFSLNNVEDIDQLFRLLISFYRVTYTNYSPEDLEILSQFITNDHFYSNTMSIYDFNNKYLDEMPSNLHLSFKLAYHPSGTREREVSNSNLYNFDDLYETDLQFDPLANQDDIHDFYLDRLNREQEEAEDYIEEQEFISNLENLIRYQEEDNSELAKKGSGLVRDYKKFKQDVSQRINQ